MAVRNCWKSRHKNSREAAPCWTGSALQLLLVLFVTQFCWGAGAVGVTKSVVQKDAEFDVIYSDRVTSENQTIYAFNHTISRNKVSLKSLEYTINPNEVRCGVEVASHLCPNRRRECVCQWTCCHRVLRVPSCLWYGRSRLCFLSRFLSYYEACKYILYTICVHGVYLEKKGPESPLNVICHYSVGGKQRLIHITGSFLSAFCLSVLWANI